MLKAYVDGSWYNGMYGGGYVVFNGDKIVYQDCGIGRNDAELLKMRNITGEMTAAMRAARWLDAHGGGVIVHDYTGLSKWVTGEWNTNNDYTEKYAKFMRPFYTLDIITFEWVKGHTNVVGNEIADKLAREAIVHKRQWKY